jgi:hypothetical protein
MTRSQIAALTLPLLLTACSVTIPVDVSTDLAFQSPAGSFQFTQQMDLSLQGELWTQKNKVDSVSVDEVTVSVVSVATGHQASTLSLALAFRPDGAPGDGSQDVVLPSFNDVTFSAGGSKSVPGSAALDTLLLQALHGSGRFQVVTVGTLNGVANATLRVELKGSAVYSTGK